MKNIFKKDTQIENDEDIIVLKKTKPIECGGTDATQDRKAPKAIISKDMYYFETESALGYVDIYSEEDPLAYINAFAVKTEKGSFISLETRGGRYYDEKKQYLAYVTYDIFPELVKLVNDNEIAKDNGFHSRTHGLPEDFGGSVNIRYASGEKISFSDNQSPILSMKVAKLIRQVFLNALKKEPVVLKDIKSLKEIRFHEEFDGGYVNVTLKINDDGTGTSHKESKYENSNVYKKDSVIDIETMRYIFERIESAKMFAWSDLPSAIYTSGKSKSLTFIFDDDSEITATNDRLLPYSIGNSFFQIELEIVTKH